MKVLQLSKVILRNHMPTLGSTSCRDSIILSILKDEWFDNVKSSGSFTLNKMPLIQTLHLVSTGNFIFVLVCCI
jgi:hypothetical protein